MSEPAPPKPNVKAMACPNCGGTVELRGMGRALSVVCIQCLSVLDPAGASLKVVQQFKAKERFRPLIPLGTRGKMRGDPYEVIGFQVRELIAGEMPYHWSEYLLFNPYKGFRYITEYNGHWNDVTVLTHIPTVGKGANNRATATVHGETYQHFQNYRATTIYVMGEFPWRIKVGESAMCDDFVSPPRMLSRESDETGTNWSLGEYTTGAEIWQHFSLPGSPPPAEGIFANQPSPHKGKVAAAWSKFLFWLLALLAIQTFWAVMHSGKTAFSQRYSFTQPGAGVTAENSFVTDIFELPGRTCNVEVDIRTDLNNNWAYFQMALINVDNGTAYDFSRQVSYYHGTDGGDSWTEGKAKDSVVLPSVPPGKYYLRVEPEMETSLPRVMGHSVRYQIEVRRDVTTWAYFFIGLLLLLVPPIWVSIRAGSFEGRRWAESDYAPSSDSDSGDDD